MLGDFLELLIGVEKIIEKQNETAKLRGEDFNIFSVLKMERRENETHSAFLAELLNPKGSHQKGIVFLSLFLQMFHSGQEFDADSCVVRKEYSIGERNDQEKTGGRIDIFLRDKKGRSICIENKIDATDQFAQVERYCKYNKEHNRVFYLSLLGNEPEDYSKGNLKSGLDFFILSYKVDIINWLEACMKEASDWPMLRESIKQYKLLLKKMTSNPDTDRENELMQILMKHLESAEYISNNFNKAKLLIGDEIRDAVINSLRSKLSDDLEVHKGDPIDKTFAQIWIKFKDHPESKLHFGLEPFNGKSAMFIGIFNTNYKESYENVLAKTTDWWYHTENFELNGEPIDFRNVKQISEIAKNLNVRQGIIDSITNQAINYIESNKNKVLEILGLNYANKV